MQLTSIYSNCLTASGGGWDKFFLGFDECDLSLGWTVRLPYDALIRCLENTNVYM